MKIIYDFGANNGDDIPYYLKKGNRVVAVEANPSLASHIRDRFAKEILLNKVVVVNKALTKEEIVGAVPFYVHKTNDVLSQFPRPSLDNFGDFHEIFVPSQRASEIIKEFGDPYYVKIDIESYDQAILEDIFSSNLRPAFISAESHNIEVFASLVASGGYKSFKLVDGASVANEYEQHSITTSQGLERYSFPHHSAGPFGDDIRGPWLTANNMFNLLANEGLGWKDIHATNTAAPDPQYIPVPGGGMGLKKCLQLLPRLALRAVRNRFRATVLNTRRKW